MHQFLQTSKYTTPIHLFPNYVTTSTESSTPKVSSFFNNMFGIRVKIALAGKGVEYEYWLQGRGFWLTTANSFWRWNQFITESLFSSTMGNQCVNPSSLFSTFFFFFFQYNCSVLHWWGLEGEIPTFAIRCSSLVLGWLCQQAGMVHWSNADNNTVKRSFFFGDICFEFDSRSQKMKCSKDFYQSCHHILDWSYTSWQVLY